MLELTRHIFKFYQIGQLNYIIIWGLKEEPFELVIVPTAHSEETQNKSLGFVKVRSKIWMVERVIMPCF